MQGPGVCRGPRLGQQNPNPSAHVFRRRCLVRAEVERACYVSSGMVPHFHRRVSKETTRQERHATRHVQTQTTRTQPRPAPRIHATVTGIHAAVTLSLLQKPQGEQPEVLSASQLSWGRALGCKAWKLSHRKLSRKPPSSGKEHLGSRGSPSNRRCLTWTARQASATAGTSCAGQEPLSWSLTWPAAAIFPA